MRGMTPAPHFFVPPTAIVGDSVTLPAPAAHHAATVLRLVVGDVIVVLDDSGTAYRSRLTNAAPKAVTAQIVESFAPPTEPRTRITVAQVLPKTGEKIEQVLQHGTEIGADSFLIFQSERSVARMETRDRVEKKLDRWRGIVQSAAEQSHRARMPAVSWARFVPDVAARMREWDAAIVCHPGATTTLRDTLATEPVTGATRLLLLIGAESGFTDSEVAALTKAGAASASLGARILRTETAALAALAQILYARNDG